MRTVTMLLIAPASQEITSILEQADEIAATRIDVTPIVGHATRSSVLAALRQRRYDIWYFVTHGGPEGLQLDDQIMPAEELIAAARSNARSARGDLLSGRRPLQCIFINTCSSAAIIDRLTEAAPIAAIGTYGEVDELTAFSVGIQWAVNVSDGIGYEEAINLARHPGIQHIYKAHHDAPAGRRGARHSTIIILAGLGLTAIMLTVTSRQSQEAATAAAHPPAHLAAVVMDSPPPVCSSEPIDMAIAVEVTDPVTVLITMSAAADRPAGSVPDENQRQQNEIITFSAPGLQLHHVTIPAGRLAPGRYHYTVAITPIGRDGDPQIQTAEIEIADCDPTPTPDPYRPPGAPG